MTRSEVNQLIENTVILTPIGTYVAIAVIFVVTLFVFMLLMFKKISRYAFFGTFIISFITTALLSMILIGSVNIVESNRAAEAEEIIKEAYINNLEVHEMEVTDFQETSSYIVEYGSFTSDKRLYIKNYEVTFIQNGELVTKRLAVELKRVEGLEQPRLEYQYLDENIYIRTHHFFQEGYYNTKLFIPK